MPKRVIPPHVLEEIKRLRAQKMSYFKIGLTTGVAEHVVRRQFSPAGVKKRAPRPVNPKSARGRLWAQKIVVSGKMFPFFDYLDYSKPTHLPVEFIESIQREAPGAHKGKPVVSLKNSRFRIWMVNRPQLSMTLVRLIDDMDEEFVVFLEEKTMFPIIRKPQAPPVEE